MTGVQVGWIGLGAMGAGMSAVGMEGMASLMAESRDPRLPCEGIRCVQAVLGEG